MQYMDQPTSLVVAGCLCVMAASGVILVVLRLCQTFCAAAKTSSRYSRLPAVAHLTSRQSTAVWNRLDDSSSSSPLTSSGAKHCLNDDNALEGNARHCSDFGVDK